MENRHFLWVNPRTKWPFSMSQTVSLPEGEFWGLVILWMELLNFNPFNLDVHPGRCPTLPSALSLHLRTQSGWAPWKWRAQGSSWKLWRTMDQYLKKLHIFVRGMNVIFTSIKFHKSQLFCEQNRARKFGELLIPTEVGLILRLQGVTIQRDDHG